MLSALPIQHERETIPWQVVIKLLPPFVSAAVRVILNSSSEIVRSFGVEPVLDDVLSGGNTLDRAETTDLVEKLRASGLESGDELGFSVGLDDGVADLGADDEAVLLDAGDSGELLDGGGSEAFGVEGGDEGGVLEPEAHAVGEDLDFAGGV